MSCDWDIRCLDCGEDHGFGSANHEDETMRIIIAHAAEIASLAPFIQDVNKRTGHHFSIASYDRLHIDTVWFAKHADHRLAPVNEYGEIDGECSKRIRCSTCGSEERCRLPKNHPGDHSPKEKR